MVSSDFLKTTRNLLLLFLALITIPVMAGNNYSSLWKKADSLKNIGQVKSALEVVNTIYSSSKSEGLQDQTIRSLLYRITLEASFEEESEHKAISFLSQEMETSSPPVKQILSSVLAQVYWRYYQNNRWEISERTVVQGDTGADISVWDAKRFIDTTSGLYVLSLSEASLLKTIPLSKFEIILEGDQKSRKYRPVLFDFLAFRAIDFFTGESRFPQSSTFSPIASNPSLFAAAHDFIREAFSGNDQASFELRALKIYRDVLSFHLSELPDEVALVDADLARLAFALRISTHPEKSELYLKALKSLAEKYKGKSVSAEIGYQLALRLKGEGELYIPGKSVKNQWLKKEALELAEETATRFPDTDGGKNCRNLAYEIRLPHLTLTGNSAVLPAGASLALVEYINTELLFARVVKISKTPGSEESRRDRKDLVREYLRQKPVAEWKVKMPSVGDFQTHSAEIRIPALPVGQYVLMVSSVAGFNEEDRVSWMDFQCTLLSLISQGHSGQTEFMVLNRKEGQPVEGVKVRKFYLNYDYNKRREVTTPGETGISGRNGLVHFDRSGNKREGSSYLVLQKDNDQFTSQSFYLWEREREEPQTTLTTWFFSDRAIYRPGQPVFFKGIVTEKNGTRINIKSRFKTVVRFRDVNDQEISKQELTTNEFGSFSGSFTIPSGGLTGSFTIGDEHGNHAVQVEEYKRPRFETVFNPVKGSYKLGEQVTMTGKAMAYSGNPVTDASVTYRVKRNARFPWFRRWFFDPPFVAGMEIAQGKTTTNGQGEFSIQFEAIADPSIPEEDLPLFDFSVEADVSDINGETHSAQTSVYVGYRALLVSTSLADEVNGAEEVKFSLLTTNLNGQPEGASGTLSIHRIKTPDQFLFPRKWKKPDLFTMTRSEFKKSFPNEIYDNEDDFSTWEKGEKILERSFSTPGDSLIGVPVKPLPGLFLLEIQTKDNYGQEVVYKKYFTLFSPSSDRNPTHNPVMATLVKAQAEPGETVPLLLASPLRNVHVVVEFTSVEGKRQTLYYRLDNSQLKVEVPVTEANRGNIGIYLYFVKNNRLFQEYRMIRVPYTNKELTLSIATFRDKLLPGAEEEWSITIRDKKGDKALAELMASMYDASLDAFLVRPWSFSLYPSNPPYIAWNADKGFGTGSLTLPVIPVYPGPGVPRTYERLIDFGFDGYSGNRRFMIRGVQPAPAMAMKAEAEMEVADGEVFALKQSSDVSVSALSSVQKTAGEEGGQALPPAKPRSDFRETAFFFPQLATNANGETVLKFRMPESLTRWKFTGLAHTKDLKTGMIEKSLVTQKELMVVPNAPRFLREGDQLRFTVKISNLSINPLKGTADLRFFDAFTMKPVDDLMGNKVTGKEFKVQEGGSTVVDWAISVPESLQAVVYRITATSGTFSDGEEAALPVLANRMLVTESLPLPVRANTSKSFTFKKLAESGKSPTLRNYRLTLEYTSQPAWYAVQALPYLMEFPYECSEQLFSRYYANTLASHIANSDPAIRRVFEAWKTLTPSALKSNLEKNEELKSVLIQESPWVREAAGETERKHRIGMLFDLTRMAAEQSSALKKLAEAQTVNGGWPWFPGMPESEYITRHIVNGLGRLIRLKAVEPQSHPQIYDMLRKAIGFLDQEMLRDFNEMKKRNSGYKTSNHLDATVIHYFYARSFFGENHPFEESMGEMVAFYKGQAAQYWTGSNNYLKAMTALFLNRMDDRKTALLIMGSLSETALRSEEMGMYWKNQASGWFWYQAPIETQSMLIEAFDEVLSDRKTVDELNIWLLKQKQTQDWKTTKATTDAVYALLLRGTNLLSSGEQVKVTVGNQQVNPYHSSQVKPEPGTGYFKTSWEAADISPRMGKVKVENPNATIAWGALYWQYFEQLDKISKAESPLKVEKNLFVEVNTPAGPVLEAITPARSIRVGDKVVVRVVLRSDRDMEYVHLKDMRASAFEPLNVLSGYRWQGGLGYYESTRDAATNFFIDYLQKGTYVFEYRLFATQKGEFSNGITSVQCMYAPEFAAHTEGIRVKVE